MKMKTHWSADMYPLNESDVDALADDIKRNGQMTPIKMLKDGSIVDGRNRWMACQKAGVEPVVEILNPDGKEIDDEKLFAISTSCNSMRRDMDTSLRACLAAEAWKRLYPEQKHGGDRKSKKDQSAKVHFETFASANFKIGERYAKQALAILNHSPELLEMAKVSLTDAYKTFQDEKAKREQAKRDQDLLNSDSAIKERVANGSLSVAEALAIIRDRDKEAVELARSLKDRRQSIVKCVITMVDMVQRNVELDPAEVREWLETEGVESMAASMGKLDEAIAAAGKLLTKMGNL